MRKPLLRLIRLYQLILSPMLGVACRYEPSCSRYSYEAIEVHGVRRGIALTARRLARCRPGGGSGYDPVPPRRDSLVMSTTGNAPHPHAEGRS